MPLKIIRQDITKIKCDAIVNPTNVKMLPSGGVDAAIHKAAGKELRKYCKNIGECPVGQARITPAFDLSCKYVIHTVGPKWQGGDRGERMLLRACYTECMKLAAANGCNSVAFPLISSGLYGYPKDRVIREAAEVISEFLSDCEMEIYIVVFDKESYSISKELYTEVQTFVDNFYTESRFFGIERYRNREVSFEAERIQASLSSTAFDEGIDSVIFKESAICEPDTDFAGKSLEDMLSNMDKGFADTLFYYIDKKGISDVEAYKRSNVGKKTFSKIKCNKDYKPSKITAISFAIGLRLNIDEARHLLGTVGMCLSRSNKFDVIIEYFITSGKYESIFEVNEVLYQFDQSLLGV